MDNKEFYEKTKEFAEKIIPLAISYVPVTEKNYSVTDFSFFSFLKSRIAFWAKTLIGQNPS